MSLFPVSREKYDQVAAQLEELQASQAQVEEALAAVTAERDNLQAQLDQAGTQTDDTQRVSELEAQLNQANNDLALVQEQLQQAQGVLQQNEGIFASLSAAIESVNHPSVEQAETLEAKTTAVVTLLSKRPNVVGTVTNEDPAKNQNTDGVDWETLNSLPHMQEE